MNKKNKQERTQIRKQGKTETRQHEIEEYEDTNNNRATKTKERRRKKHTRETSGRIQPSNE